MPGEDADKAEWRAWARAEREQLPDRSAELCGHLGHFLQARGCHRVLAYHALPGEPDIGSLAAQFQLYTTRARFRDRRLSLHDWHSASELSRFGARQPPAGTPEHPREHLDVVLLPGLAFDRRGVRLGYGGGFYDRLLAGWAVLRVGVCWQNLLVDRLPEDPHDVRMDALATEAGVRAALS